MKIPDEVRKLLGSLEYLYLLLDTGVQATASSLQKESGVDSKLWRKLINCSLIERTGWVSKPTYRWNFCMKEPDYWMAVELIKDYPVFNNDDLYSDQAKNALKLSKHPFFMDEKRKLKEYHSHKDELTDDELIEMAAKMPRRNKPIKTETMLHQKDQLFNWTIPEGKIGRNLTSDFRANTKSYTSCIGWQFMQEYGLSCINGILNVAFVNLTGNETPYIVFNPKPGVPFFKYSVGKGDAKHKSPTVANKALSELLRHKFNAKSGDVINCEINPYKHFNEMLFFNIHKIS